MPRHTTRNHSYRFVIRHLPFVIPALLLVACQSGPSTSKGDAQPVLNRDPAGLLSILASTSTPDDSRQHADKLLVEQKGKTDPARLDVLEQLLYAPGHSDAMRIYALDQLADANPARAGHALELYLPRFKGPVLDHACQLVVTLGDARLIAPLTRSLARIAHPRSQPPMQTLNDYTSRPEWPAIEKLAGKPPGDAFFDLIDSANDQSVRIAALDVLQAITARETIADSAPSIATTPGSTTSVGTSTCSTRLPSAKPKTAGCSTSTAPNSPPSSIAPPSTHRRLVQKPRLPLRSKIHRRPRLHRRCLPLHDQDPAPQRSLTPPRPA